MKWCRKLASLLWLGIRLVILVATMIVCYAAAAELSGFTSVTITETTSRDIAPAAVSERSHTLVSEDQASWPDANRAQLQLFGTMAIACALNTIVIALMVLRSRLTGWRLMLALTLVFFSCLTAMPQIEAIFFLGMSAQLMRKLTVMGLVVAVCFSIAAVLVLGRARSNAVTPNVPCGIRLEYSRSQWVLIGMLVAVGYTVIYVFFGYFIAWRVPVVRDFYGGGDLLSFGEHVLSRPMLQHVIPLQLMRGILWFGIALVIIRMHCGGWVEVAFTVALCFAVLMNAQLLLPNPMMPAEVRKIHLIETASSNFLFGLVLVWILFAFSRQHREP